MSLQEFDFVMTHSIEMLVYFTKHNGLQLHLLLKKKKDRIPIEMMKYKNILSFHCVYMSHIFFIHSSDECM